ncbi:MAG: hypothetical protein KJ600_05895 [Nanoarchaeota archaeon]|nr:hypothetical protein [Nanoarchaeota archaeon]MBU1104061.1 hypothetical protein [Nanoarchaeota archaeon]
MDGLNKMNWAQKLKAPEVKFPKGIFSFYLSHPFASREYVRKWELGFEGRHPKIALINPFYDVEGEGRDDVRARDAGEKFKKLPGYDWRLTQRDYIAICYSRAIVGIIDENAGKSIGTLMEFVMARALAKSPKLLICTNEKLRGHPWLKTHFHKIYPSFEEFEEDVEKQVMRVQEKWGF